MQHHGTAGSGAPPPRPPPQPSAPQARRSGVATHRRKPSMGSGFGACLHFSTGPGAHRRGAPGSGEGTPQAWRPPQHPAPPARRPALRRRGARPLARAAPGGRRRTPPGRRRPPAQPQLQRQTPMRPPPPRLPLPAPPQTHAPPHAASVVLYSSTVSRLLSSGRHLKQPCTGEQSQRS